MSKGKRYDTEPKLNIKKVIAVIIAFAVIIMFIVGIKTLLTKDTNKITTTISGYFPLYTNGKWGVINEKGEIVIKPEYIEMITIPDSKTDLFIILYDVDYTNNTYKTKVLNSKNEEKFKTYDLVEAIENINNNNILCFSEGVLKVKKGGKYGLIDFSGNEILSTEYSNIEALSGVKNSLLIKKDNKIGLCDNKGNIIINPEYKEIKSIGNDYKNGYIVITDDNKYGIIDFTNQVILEANYQEIKQITSDNIYIVKENGKLKAINKNKETLIENKFDDVKEINSNNIIFVKDNKYGVMDKKGNTIIQPQYEDLKYAFNEYYIAKKAGKYGIINATNQTVLEFNYSKISYRNDASFIEAEKQGNINTEILNEKLEKKIEGIISQVNTTKGYIRIRVNDEYKYYNLKFEEIKSQDALTVNTLFLNKKDGKYGYIDKSGNIVIDYIYDDATEQNEYGYAAVKKDGRWNALDKDGRELENKYELKNNILVDFIGNWHLAEDVNSYYYTDAE